MTPEEAARRVIACTATGALSCLPKWEWCAGMLTQEWRTPEDKLQHPAWRVRDERNGAWPAVYFADRLVRWEQDATPDFTDEPTVLAMLPLVRRAWTGHVVDLTLRADGNVDLLIFTPGGPAFIVDDVPLYEALTLALEAAPEKPCSRPSTSRVRTANSTAG